MKIYTGFLIVSLFAALISVSHAEMRTWTDVNGRKVDAELIENMHGHVSLRTKDNKTVHVSISRLCAADEKYVLRNTPPEIKVDVVEDTDRHNKSFGGGGSDDDDVEKATSRASRIANRNLWNGSLAPNTTTAP